MLYYYRRKTCINCFYFYYGTGMMQEQQLLTRYTMPPMKYRCKLSHQGSDYRDGRSWETVDACHDWTRRTSYVVYTDP